ncbi:MAG: YgaP family membrane protein [Steroidobacteraceae bacterium]
MNIDRFVLAFAGAVVLISLSLGVWVDQNWFFLTAFVGLNLLQSSITGFCPLAMILRKLGLQSGVAFK